jgi:hypothetical protein
MLSASATEHDIADVRLMFGRHGMKLPDGPCQHR